MNGTNTLYGVVDRRLDDLVIEGPFLEAVEAESMLCVLRKTRPSPSRFEIVRWHE